MPRSAAMPESNQMLNVCCCRHRSMLRTFCRGLWSGTQRIVDFPGGLRRFAVNSGYMMVDRSGMRLASHKPVEQTIRLSRRLPGQSIGYGGRWAGDMLS